MGHGNAFAASKVRDRPGHSQDPVIGTCRERQPGNGLAKQGISLGARRAVRFCGPDAKQGVCASLAALLPIARALDPSAQMRTRLTSSRCGELVDG